MRRFFLALGLVPIAAAAIAVACVPADTRPPPSALTLTVSPSPAVATGVVTTDGWSIVFDRVLVNLGNAGLGETCTIYGEADYDRLLDVTRDGGQALGVIHGIGSCDVDFRLGPPSADSILGEGVTEDDKTRLRTPGGDPYVPLGGIAAEIALTARRAGVTKQFRLMFRSRIRYRDCTPVADSGLPAVELPGSSALTYDLRIEAEAILRDDVDVSSSLRFDPLANADTNADGVITLDELRAVPIDVLRDGGAFEAGTYTVDDAGIVRRGQPVVIATLGDYIYEVLTPTLARYRDTGTCVATGRRPN